MADKGLKCLKDQNLALKPQKYLEEIKTWGQYTTTIVFLKVFLLKQDIQIWPLQPVKAKELRIGHKHIQGLILSIDYKDQYIFSQSKKHENQDFSILFNIRKYVPSVRSMMLNFSLHHHSFDLNLSLHHHLQVQLRIGLISCPFTTIHLTETFPFTTI